MPTVCHVSCISSLNTSIQKHNKTSGHRDQKSQAGLGAPQQAFFSDNRRAARTAHFGLRDGEWYFYSSARKSGKILPHPCHLLIRSYACAGGGIEAIKKQITGVTCFAKLNGIGG